MEVAPGIVWVRMPLPYALDHVNVWLLAEPHGWTLVDTGHGDDATRDAWEALAPRILGGRPIHRVICTHHHPDHMGLAGWMSERWGAEMWATRTEWLEGRARTSGERRERERAAEAFYRRAGVPAPEIPSLVDRSHSFADHVTRVPPSYRRIRDGDVVAAGDTRWRILVGRGHAPEHACLLSEERGVLISGDQVLQHISPNVGVWPDEPEADPLAEYLETMEEFLHVPDGIRVLPSHGHPFIGPRQRVEYILRHHRERLTTAWEACQVPRTTHEVARALFRGRLDSHQVTFAIGEALAHLHRLEGLGDLQRVCRPGEPDRYRQAGPEAAGLTAGA